jgi:hypothetical protein
MSIIQEPVEKAMAVPPASTVVAWTTGQGDESGVGLGHNSISVLLDFSLLTLDTSGDHLDVYLQTYWLGKWMDIACYHVENGDAEATAGNAEKLINHRWDGTSEVGVAFTDGTMADDTVDNSIPLGHMVRLKIAETVDYTITLEATMRTWFQ